MAKKKVSAPSAASPEQKSAGETLLEFQILLSAIADSTTDMIWSVDAERFGLLTFNKGFREYYAMLGITAEQGMRPQDLSSRQEYIQTWQGFFERALQEGDFMIEYETFTSRRTLELNFHVLRHAHKVFGISVFGKDITERKKAEAKIAALAARNETLLRTASDGVHIIDNQGNVVEANDTFCRMLGYTREEMLKMNVADWDVQLGEEKRLGMIKDLMGAPKMFETVHRRKDGRLLTIEINATSVTLEGRSYLYASARDITDRRNIEQALHNAQKMESLGIVTGGIAHDFNNLLGIMMGNASLAHDELPDGHPAAVCIENAITAMERAAELTKQMLTYTGKGMFETQTVDLTDIVQRQIQLCMGAASKNVTIEPCLPSQPLYVNGDPGQLRQILGNLISNSTDAIGEKEGSISVSLSEVTMGRDEVFQYDRITNSQLSEGRYALLEVRDNGCGMSRETMNKIFDPFFTTKFTGRGLGLSAVFGIVQGHKGGIDVGSEMGEGTAFRVILPLTHTSLVEEAAAAFEDKKAGASTQTILVIEDEPDMARMAGAMLEKGGYQVMVEVHPVRGIELYKKHREQVGAVLLDLTMPEMSGKAVADVLHAIDPGVKIIVTSGYSEEDTLKKFGSVKVSGFIQKPYRFQSLLSIVRRVLE